MVKKALKVDPKNASNLLAIRVLSRLKPNIIEDDFKTWNIVRPDDKFFAFQ